LRRYPPTPPATEPKNSGDESGQDRRLFAATTPGADLGDNYPVVTITRGWRAYAVGGIVAVGVLLSGCANTVGGNAVRAQGRGGRLPTNAPQLTASQLDRLLLNAPDIGSIVGTSDLKVTSSSKDMTDNSGVVSDIDCLGAVYGAEKQVYNRSGWTGVRDVVLSQAGPRTDYWVEQTAVLFPSADKAKHFLDTSRDQWQGCTSVTTIGDNHSTFVWDFADVLHPNPAMITQDSEQQNANGWACQHAMGTVSNLLTESFACGYHVSDQGEQIVTRILQNAARQ
jgi:hypothetical protein